MKTRRRLTTILAALLFSLLPVGTLVAQDDAGGPPAPDTVQTLPSSPPPESASSQNTDPPGRVARIQYMSGEVSMQPGGVNDWVAASQNRPLTTSDRVWTDKSAKAELSVGDAFIRMNSETSVTLTNVSDDNVQVELDQGTLELTVRHLDGGEIFEVDTPNAAFTVTKTGVYRFDVYPNEDQTWITARKGSGEATGSGNAVKVNSGQQVRFSHGNTLTHTAEAAPSNDGFDDWAKVRDERLEHSESARYVSPGVIGAQDLDQYGRWQQTPQYGAIWVPTSVAPGWAPYRYGHWAWIDPWGWTWVDDAPWGFAPFHYGRWVSYGGYWGWAPGPIGYWRPYYAPALVGWVGGPGFGIGFGGGGWGVGINFGWFALGFGEPFYPWYGGWGWGHGGWYRGGGYGGYCSRGYFNRVNVTNTNITNITNVTNNYYTNNIKNTTYVNQHVNGAVTAAPKSAFTSGANISRAGVAVPASALRNAQLVRTAAVAPTKQSVLGGQAAAKGTPPASAFNRPVVTRNPPPQRQGNLVAGHTSTPGAANNNVGTPHAPLARPVTEPRLAQPAATAHNVPRPPSAGGTTSATNGNVNNGGPGHSNATPAQTSAVHNVPRPPSANDTFVRGNNSPAQSGNAVHPATSGVTQPGAASHSGSAPNQNLTAHNVPRPPGNYTYQQPTRSASGTTPQAGHNTGYQAPPPQHSGTTAQGASGPAQHQPAPAPHQSAPPSQQHQAAPAAPHQASPAPHQSAPAHDTSKSGGPSASGSVPRPPSGYSYRSAPVYTASSAYGSNRAASPYGNSSPYNRGGSSYGNSGYSRSPANYGAASGYAGSRGGYQPAPAYGSGPGNSGGGPSYSARSAAPSYSAPHSYGGGGHYSSGGGGGGSHPSGGGGGHPPGGGGGGHSSGGGGRH